jgi:predicted GTPase
VPARGKRLCVLQTLSEDLCINKNLTIKFSLTCDENIGLVAVSVAVLYILMGGCDSRCLSTNRIEIKIAVIGLDNAGKSTVVNNLTGDYQGLVAPTLGFASAKITFDKISITIFDLGGSATIRNYWVNYYHEVCYE